MGSETGGLTRLGRKRASARATIIPTAIFVAMFVLLTATILIANVSYSFGLSLRSVETTESRYLSFAAVNELLSDLNGGALEPDTFTEARPRSSQTGGYTTEAWVESMDRESSLILVVARTYRQSGSRPEAVSRLANYSEFTHTRVYANVTDTDTSTPNPIYFSDLNGGDSWERLPNIPRVRYDRSGRLEVKEGEWAGAIPFVTGAPDGSVFALYAPVLDGWGDEPSSGNFHGVPMTKRWGEFALKTIVSGSRQGLTIGDLAPIPQILVSHVERVTLSEGATLMRYSHESGQWSALPPAEEARYSDGGFIREPGNYHIQGVAGPPVANEGSVSLPLFRKGHDSIYRYDFQAEDWEVLTPPGIDVMLLASDEKGTLYTQTGELRPVGLLTLLDILLGDLIGLRPNTATSKIHRFADGEWHEVPDPPARFFRRSGELVERAYSGRRGPVLGAMVGGKDGELYVTNRPSDSGLVDTVYRFSDGAWEVVPSPPGTYHDRSGQQVETDELPSRIELGMGAGGQLVFRVPSTNFLDSIFVQSEGDRDRYDLLPPVHTAGSPFEDTLSQMSVGNRQGDNGLGSYRVRATYFGNSR